MKKFLKKDIVQRSFYILGLIILFFVSFKDGTEVLKQESSLGIIYWYFFIVPCCILIYQFIFNNRVGWISLLLLFCAYVIWLIIELIRGIKDIHFEIGDYLGLLIVFLILFSLGLLLINLKPLKKNKKVQHTTHS